MTNVLLLDFAIKRAGLTHKEVARQLNLASSTFSKKATNVVEFRASEIAALYKLLKLSSCEEQQRIFFADDISNPLNIPLPEDADLRSSTKEATQ